MDRSSQDMFKSSTAENLIDARKTGEEKLFADPPRVNVISKEAYEKRVSEVFELLYQTLARSFGPYGAPTIIYNYPFSHVTKDGFTIMKNLSMDASKQLVDQSIANAVSDICGRLNYQVGDGTTSAVVATNSIYKNYINDKSKFDKHRLMPRDIISAFEDVKTKITEVLSEYVETIHTEDMDELYSKIYDIVYISSNGNEYFAEMIASLYKEIGYPGINCKLADGGDTHSTIINGYQFDLSLMDRLYINSDDDTLTIENGADIIIFQVKITKSIYDNILKPLNEACRARGRKLIVCASSYDEVALGQTIRHDLNAEFKAHNSVNMVLCIYKSISDYTRQLANDFAMLCNTIIIDRQMKTLIEEKLDKLPIHKIFNIDRRDDIPNLLCAGYLGKTKEKLALYQNGQDDMKYDGVVPIIPIDVPDDAIRLGYTGKCTIGLKTSIFKEFYYNENMYNASIKEAENTLKETEQKYARLGTFNLAVGQAQQRLYSLKLKMGLIEVSGDGELSQKMTKDAIDDAIRAAESAFKYGIIRGCNIDMIRSIESVYENICNESLFDESNNQDAAKRLVALTLRNGFVDVYRTVLTNAFDDTIILPESDVYGFPQDHVVETIKSTFKDYLSMPNVFDNISDDIIKEVAENNPNEYIESVDSIIYLAARNVHFNGYTTSQNVMLIDFIVSFSILTRTVLDLGNRKFNTSVINSMQTDVEILRATIDLISLLIAGNQMVVTQKHNF